MKRLVVLLSLFLLAATEKQDLLGKMLTFPVESKRHHVILSPLLDETNFTCITVCLRAFSDLSRGQTLFSLALPESDNAFVIYKPKREVYRLHVGEPSVDFWGLEDELNVWNSVCATWDGKTGLSQMWVNGKPSTRKGFSRLGSLSGTPKIILGQDQDSYGGGFDISQSFVGMLTDVHMWNSVLSPSEISQYMHDRWYQSGNVLNWDSLEFSKIGYVITESVKTTQKLKIV
ncbi:serum amyloid P-component-like [Tachysurus fulvidraco]|uniref:serum amyloid P-component-like n=1 Tax=Tachysurus fulvidraco TaxID=1234273 RepID=UPI001FED9CCB|nr:serum amyloid P-component-like [Tachysurus fulvidraco]